jgi:hypothetical protein
MESPFTFADFSQHSTGQAAWMFAYFHSGTFDRIDCGDKGPELPCYRFCFFLHYYKAEEPVETPQGPLVWPGPALEAPPELVEAWPYKWPWA